MLDQFCRKTAAAALLCCLCLVGCSGSSSKTPGNEAAAVKATNDSSGKQLTVAVIPKSTGGEFWQTVEVGAKSAAKDLGVNIKWEGALVETEIADENKIIENMVNLGVDGIAMAPINPKAMRKPVENAVAAGIPVVVFDSALDGTAQTSFVATDNTAGGALGAKFLVDKLTGPSKRVIMLRYIQGTASTESRAQGFLDAAHAANVEVLADAYTEDGQVSGAKKTSANVLEGFVKDGKLDLDGIFCCNLNATQGMLAALEDLHKSGVTTHLVFVGFDSSPKMIEQLKHGDVDALVVQNPKKMGYLAVETLVKHLRGEKVEPRIDTGVELVTAERVEKEPEIRKLVGLELMPATPRLKMVGVSKRFGATRALERVDLEIAPGEILALVGENGAGKSTLMKVLSGAHQPDEGQMWLDGQLYRPRQPLDARRQGIAMIYQELSLAPHLSVMENIMLGIEPTTGPFVRWSAMRSRAAAALEEIGVGDIPPDVEVRRLSLAQQQMVEIARAVALESRVVVLDEPTSSLTRRDIQRLFALIRRLRERGIAVIYISHFLEEVCEISDRYAVLRDGQSVGGGTTAGSSTDHMIALMVGRAVDDLYPRSSRREDGKVALEIRNLAGAAKPTSASLQLRRGRVLGISGLIGAGRTELMRALFGLDRVRSGEIRVGHLPGPAPPQRRWAQGVGMVSEDRKREGLALGLSIADNLTMARLDGLGPWRFVTPSRQRAATLPWINRIPIKCASPAQRVGAISGGNQQKVALARLLHADVDVLLLDEPTRGIDVGSKAQIYQLIDDLVAGDPANGRKPKAILMISSYLPELLGVCDEIAVMSRGRLGDTRPIAEWDEHRLMLAATGKEEARSA